MRQILDEKLDEVNKLDAENEKQVDNLTEASLKANSTIDCYFRRGQYNVQKDHLEEAGTVAPPRQEERKYG